MKANMKLSVEIITKEDIINSGINARKISNIYKYYSKFKILNNKIK